MVSGVILEMIIGIVKDDTKQRKCEKMIKWILITMGIVIISLIFTWIVSKLNPRVKGRME